MYTPPSPPPSPLPLPPSSVTAVAYRFPSSVSYCLATAVAATVTANAADPGQRGLPQSTDRAQTPPTAGREHLPPPAPSSFAANGGKPKLHGGRNLRPTNRPRKKTLF
ncbi:hypothetical protein ACI65C_000970 [Semiaphis heraclei]